MIIGVADTHTAVWYLFNDPRLSQTAGDFIDQAVIKQQQVGISAITLAEIVYLVEKGRVPEIAYRTLFLTLSDPGHVFTEVPFTAAVVETMRSIPRSAVPDMPDRVIASTAAHLNVPILSRDRHIRLAAVETIW